MKNIAIITGASSGMGREFTNTFENYFNVDEVWVIARSVDKLIELQENIKTKVVPLSIDISNEKDINKLTEKLKEEKPDIKLLINAAGYGKFGHIQDISAEENIGMIKLNCEGLTRITLECLPYMIKDSFILNIASVASFQPVPYINIYAATKAYVLSFTRSLNKELKSKNIHVMALCPYWTKTNFFARAEKKDKVVKKYVVMYEPDFIVTKAWKALLKKKEVCIPGFIARGQVILTKFVSHNFVMKLWMKQNDLK